MILNNAEKFRKINSQNRTLKPGKSTIISISVCPWTKYKFTCVCVCVCVSVTLSVNSPTGHAPQQIFTVDSLKDAYLRKDLLFGDLDDE